MGALWLGTMTCDCLGDAHAKLGAVCVNGPCPREEEHNTSTDCCLVSVPSSTDNAPILRLWSISLIPTRLDVDFIRWSLSLLNVMIVVAMMTPLW